MSTDARSEAGSRISTVTVLGLGPMGRALAGALVEAGFSVTVWNRTPSRADGLLEKGAHWAATPGAAVAASDVTLINVVDHDVLDEIVGAAGTAVSGRVIVGLASDTPERARRTAEAVHAAGGRYLDGAIMTPTPTIGTPAASILFAGPREVFDRCSALFVALGATTWLGEEHGRAAGFDMALLDLFWTSVGGFLHALKVAQANGVGPVELLPHALGIVDILPDVLTGLTERMRDDHHTDSDAPVSSVAASLRHLVAASQDAGVEATALRALQRSVDAVVAAGHGADEITRVLALR